MHPFNKNDSVCIFCMSFRRWYRFNTLGNAKLSYTIDTLVQQINVGLRLYLWSLVTMKCWCCIFLRATI